MKNNKLVVTKEADLYGLRQISLHESSHAVIGWSLGLTINKVTIEGSTVNPDDSDSPYVCSFAAGPIMANAKLARDEIFANVDMKLASAAIEQKKIGSPYYPGLNDSFEAIHFLTFGGDPDVCEIMKSALEILERPNDKNWLGRALEFYNAHGARVQKLLDDPEISKAVDRLANYLMRRKTVTGYEAVRAIEKGWTGPLPEKAKPADKHPTEFKGVTSIGVENSVSTVKRLAKASLKILRECRPENSREEKILESACRQILGVIFIFHGLLEKIKNTEGGPE